MSSRNKTLWILIFMLVALWAIAGPAMAARIAGNDRPVNTSSETPAAPPSPPGYGNAQKDQTSPTAAPANEATPAQPAKKKSTPKKKATGQSAKKTTARPPQATGTIPAEANKAKYITMDFDNVDIGVFVKFMSEMTHRNFVIDDNVKGKITVFSPRKISVDEAYKVFESVLEVHGLAAVPAGDVTKIIQAKDAKEKNIETRLRAQAISPHDKIVTQIVSLNHANPDDMKKVLDPLISRTSVIVSYPPTGMLIITDVLSNVKRLLSIISALDVAGVGEQIAVIPLKHAGATEMVTTLNAIFGADVTAARRTALPYAMKIIADDRTNSVLVRASEADAGRIRELVKLLDREAPKGESRMQVYRLQYANAEDLAKILMNLPVVKDAKVATPAAAVAPGARTTRSPAGATEIQIVADKATNTLIITASKDDYRTLEEVIRKIDVPRAMVYIEALLMEVSVRKDFKVGVEWRFLKDTGSVPGFDTGRSAALGGSGGLGPGGSYTAFPGDSTSPQFPSGFSLGIIGAGISIGDVIFPNIGAVLQAVQRDSDVYILSNPQLLTSDNEEASVIVGKNIPYITRQERSTTNVDYTNYEYKDVGVTLKITPTINTEKFVRQKIDLEVTQLVTEESSTGLPTTLKRATKTVVSVKDGQTIVISGIMGDSTEKAVYKVPLLGDIPLLGWLFKSKSDTRDKTNLYVFITPHVIENQMQGVAIKEKKQEQIETFEGGVIKGYKWRDFGIDSPRSRTAPQAPVKP
jgi:general secretion pathway protein D